MASGLSCPKCKHLVEKISQDYKCTNCKISYPVTEGYIDLLGNIDFYAGEATQADMKSLIENIDTLGYEKGLKMLYQKYPYLAEYINDIRRGDWICHCVGKNTRRALDIGSGLGNLSEMLSYSFQEVYSLEAVKERVQFQVRRYKNSNRPNITILRGNALELPFPDNFFDLVVCNGVLEWVGSMNTMLPPREGQIAFLKEIKRVLSYTGCLYVGIENRFGLWFLLGAKDHSGLRYTSLFPRKLSNILVKKYGNMGGIYGDKSKHKKEERGYYEYTYSSWGYRALLTEAGFTFKPYWVYPSYNQPFFSGRLDDKEGLKGFIKYLKTNNSKFKIMLTLLEKTNNSVLKFFTSLITPSFLFYCYKSNIDEVLDDVIVKKSLLNNYTVISGGHTIMYLLYDKMGDPKKIAHLKRYKYELPSTLTYRDKIGPMPQDGSERIWIEDWFPGRKLDPLNQLEMEMAIDWLIHFQNDNRCTPITRVDVNHEFDYIIDVTKDIGEISTDKNILLLEKCRSLFLNFNLFRTAEHGDFWFGNILFNPKTNSIRVIDWEYFQLDGNPLYDFAFFALNAMLGPTDSESEFISNLNNTGKFTPVMRTLERKVTSHFGFEIDIVNLLPYVIFRFVATKVLERKRKDKTIINYEKMLVKYQKLLDILSKYD